MTLLLLNKYIANVQEQSNFFHEMFIICTQIVPIVSVIISKLTLNSVYRHFHIKFLDFSLAFSFFASIPWPRIPCIHYISISIDTLSLYICSLEKNSYHKWTPALPKPIPANTLAKCISDLAFISSGFSTDLQNIKIINATLMLLKFFWKWAVFISPKLHRMK